MLSDTMRKIFIKITKEGQKIYALDWQHSSFLYDPRNLSEQRSCVVKDERYTNGEYSAYYFTKTFSSMNDYSLSSCKNKWKNLHFYIPFFLHFFIDFYIKLCKVFRLYRMSIKDDLANWMSNIG